MSGIFHAYDIRGIYPTQITTEFAESLGLAIANLLLPDTCVVGYDMRDGGVQLAAALGEGLRRGGCDSIDIGMCSTPMNYFGIANYGYGAGIQITASHNTSEYNGFKVSGADARPVSYDTGLRDAEQLIANGDLREVDTWGEIKSRKIRSDYYDYVLSWHEPGKNKIKLVVDGGNGISGVDNGPLWPKLPYEVATLYMEPDAKFPNHTPDPTKEENVRDLIAKVTSSGAAIGIGFDGDADRAAFIDETGRRVPADSITALIAQNFLRDNKGAKIILDLRSSWAVREAILESGGVPVIYRVGHSYIKAKMRDIQAIFAGELSGHYYYRDNFYTDSGIITALTVLNILTRTGRPLSELIKVYDKYHRSGERNYKVADSAAVLVKLEERYGKGAKKVEKMDGLSVEFDDWWFNVRPSNTEPVVRMNVETKSENLLTDKLGELELQLKS